MQTYAEFVEATETANRAYLAGSMDDHVNIATETARLRLEGGSSKTGGGAASPQTDPGNGGD